MDGGDDISTVALTLQGATSNIDEAKAPEASGGIPPDAGLYAWWVEPGAIPGLTGPSHPVEARELLYVGIAPVRKHSAATIRTRVLRQHVRGNIGASTFRLSLAALLIQHEGWTAVWKHDRALLESADNKKLSTWQRVHLRLTWAKHPCPRDIEDDVIALLRPPLNLAGNLDEPFHDTLADARAALRTEALSSK
jgi:hypothetical protein